MPYDSNLSLPLCPKCLDTKHVARNQAAYPLKMPYGEFYSYTCHACGFYWESTGYNSSVGEENVN